MKILLDECVPVQLIRALSGLDAMTAQQRGWSALSNGELLRRAEESGFDVLIIADKNLRYQQNLADRKIAIPELWTNHRPTLETHFAQIRNAVEKLKPHDYVIFDER